MTDPRDPDRLIQAFLAEGQAELPDRAYDAVRSHIDSTRQRVVIGPWREPRMPTIARIAIAAAAVLVVAVVGINLLPSSNLGGIAASSPSVQPSASASNQAVTASPTSPPSPAASASPAALVYEWPKPIQAGTYTTQFIWDIPFQVTFTVPDRWESRDVEVLRDPGPSVSFQLVDNVSADPCKQIGRTPKVGPSVDALATALATLPGADTTAPTATTLAGYSGKVLELFVPADVGCPAAQYQLWTNAPESVVTGRGPMGSLTWSAELPNSRIWILDIDGVRLVISGLWPSDATPADLSELQAVIDSIRIVPAVEGVATGDCTLELRGLAPPYTVAMTPHPGEAPSARVLVTGSGWGNAGPGRTVVSLIQPDGRETFPGVSLAGGEIETNLEMASPGTWRLKIVATGVGCTRDIPITVLPVGGG